MKSSLAKKLCVIFSAAFFCITSLVVAQPAASPLDVQGLNQFVITGARARAMGGTSIATGNDATALFSNPAELSQLTSLEIRAGGIFNKTMRDQTQTWVPLKTLPGISVLFEGLSGTIKTPDSLGVPGHPLSPWNSFQKQYDNIGPNWNTNSSKTQPLTFVAAMPLTVAGINITAGIGVAQIINLDNYYQNNNSMSPYYGQERPYAQWSKPVDTLHIKWYQYMRSRDGSVYGVTPGISFMVLPSLTIGGSVTVLSGSSDDLEQRVERGHLNIAVQAGEPHNFMLDTVYYYQTKTGTSTYTGNILTFGLLFQQPRFSVGLTIKPQMTLTRTWDRNVTSIDTTRKSFPVRIDSLTSRSYHESGTDQLTFPLSYSLGIVVKPTEKWVIAVDYVIKNLADVALAPQPTGTSSNPWINNKAEWHLGAEYRAGDMLALRGGYHEDIQPFSPDGSAIVDKPASGEIYSLGIGLKFGNILFDLAYEYSILKYEDVYQSNVNYSTREQHNIIIEVAYRF